MKRALVIGSNGTIGSAISTLLASQYELHTLSQTECDYSEESLKEKAEKLKQMGGLDTVICCIGTLHNERLSPEKRLNALSAEKLAEYFHINTVLPALCLKAFVPTLKKDEATQFALLSAMVGSIGDNQLGGWYGYRSSKAALNMIMKTASVEVARTHKLASLAVIHPGTTIGPLSKPFASGVSQDKYYTPEQSAARIIDVVAHLKPEHTGQFFNWNGQTIPW